MHQVLWAVSFRHKKTRINQWLCDWWVPHVVKVTMLWFTVCCYLTWAWAPPVANTPLQTLIKVLRAEHLRAAHTTCITDIQLRKHLCASQFSVTMHGLGKKCACKISRILQIIQKALMTYPLKLLHFTMCCNYHKWCLNIRAWGQRGSWSVMRSEIWVVDYIHWCYLSTRF